MKSNRWLITICACLIAVSIAAAGFSQETPEPSDKSETEGATPAIPSPVIEPVEATPLPPQAERKAVAPSAEGQPTSPGRVTFDFKEADLRNILRIFSVRYGINVVAGPDVKGKVTIRLVDVPWESALRLILETNNYAYVKKDNIYRILSRDQLEKEPLETQVFPLSYATANDVVGSVVHLLTPERGQVKADMRSNALVVTDIPSKLNTIEEIIKRLDKRTPQVLIEARVLELTEDFGENIGIDWVTLKGFNITFGPPQDEGLFEIKRERVKTRTDSTDRTYTDEDTLTRTDKRDITDRRGPDGTTTTTTISTVPGTSSGTTITTTSGTSRTDTMTSEDERLFIDGYEAVGLDRKSDSVTTTDIRQAVLTPDDFQLTLSFLQEQTDANVISHPKLVTADNKESVIKVAKEWPIPNFQFNDDTGQWEISDFEWRDIGIILTVTPQVNEDDFITMKVVPEISDIFGTTRFGGAVGAELPIIYTRKAKTEVLVKNGDTLAIGGLMLESEKDTVSRMPVLGQIPILGKYIFGQTGSEIDKSNIIIFITANVVTLDNKDSLWVAQREDQIRQMNLPKTKWWEPKKLRYGLGAKAGY